MKPKIVLGLLLMSCLFVACDGTDDMLYESVSEYSSSEFSQEAIEDLKAVLLESGFDGDSLFLDKLENYAIEVKDVHVWSSNYLSSDDELKPIPDFYARAPEGKKGGLWVGSRWQEIHNQTRTFLFNFVCHWGISSGSVVDHFLMRMDCANEGYSYRSLEEIDWNGYKDTIGQVTINWKSSGYIVTTKDQKFVSGVTCEGRLEFYHKDHQDNSFVTVVVD